MAARTAFGVLVAHVRRRSLLPDARRGRYPEFCAFRSRKDKTLPVPRVVPNTNRLSLICDLDLPVAALRLALMRQSALRASSGSHGVSLLTTSP